MGRPKNFIREDVIQKAMNVFWLKGYSATSLSDLTEATGLNKKSLYNEFGNKEELFEIALSEYNKLKAPQIEVLQKEPLGKSNVQEYLDLLGRSTNIKGCLLALSINENNLLETKAKGQVKANFKALNILIFQNLSQDYSKQEATSLSLLMSSMMFSTAALAKISVDKDEIKKMLESVSNLLN